MCWQAPPQRLSSLWYLCSPSRFASSCLALFYFLFEQEIESLIQYAAQRCCVFSVYEEQLLLCAAVHTHWMLRWQLEDWYLSCFRLLLVLISVFIICCLSLRCLARAGRSRRWRVSSEISLNPSIFLHSLWRLFIPIYEFLLPAKSICFTNSITAIAKSIWLAFCIWETRLCPGLFSLRCLVLLACVHHGPDGLMNFKKCSFSPFHILVIKLIKNLVKVLDVLFGVGLVSKGVEKLLILVVCQHTWISAFLFSIFISWRRLELLALCSPWLLQNLVQALYLLALLDIAQFELRNLSIFTINQILNHLLLLL